MDRESTAREVERRARAIGMRLIRTEPESEPVDVELELALTLLEAAGFEAVGGLRRRLDHFAAAP